jgi:hypothetical protein
MLAGPSVDEHHFVPKSRKGREKSFVHRICHRKIHSLFDEKSLERTFNTPEALVQDPEMAKFVAWLANKPPEFYDNSRTSGQRRR